MNNKKKLLVEFEQMFLGNNFHDHLARSWNFHNMSFALAFLLFSKANSSSNGFIRPISNFHYYK